MAYIPVDAIVVGAWGRKVGALALDPGTGYYAFEYEPSWIERGVELAPLRMPLGREPYVFPSLPIETFKRLPAALADALPDDFGNALIDAYLSERGVSREHITPLDRLAYVGGRAMGALQFAPSRGPKPQKSTAIELSELVLGARKALQGSFDGDRETEAAIRNLYQVSTSAGGARAKAVIAFNRRTRQMRSGQLPAQPEFEHWLIKFDGVGKDKGLEPGGGGTGAVLGATQNYGRIEYAYHLMAIAAKIHMSDCLLLEESGRAHFMTRRFDREGDLRHHLQTLCAVDHLDYKQVHTHSYAQYFDAIERIGLGPGAAAEAFRRMAFNVMAANCDDHTKNFSFLLRQDGAWNLSPAYDITHAHDPDSKWINQHLMSVQGRFSGITDDDMIALGDRHAVPGMSEILGDVRAAVASWPEFARKAGLPATVIRRVGKDLLKRV